jgi:hypothetical protein
MTPLGREKMFRYSVALALIYGLLAVRYLVLEGDPSKTPYLQSLALGWAFAVMAVVASVFPARARPPHVEA